MKPKEYPGNYEYKTTCLACGWHKDVGASFSEIHTHLDDCTGPVIVSIQTKD